MKNDCCTTYVNEVAEAPSETFKQKTRNEAVGYLPFTKFDSLRVTMFEFLELIKILRND